MAYLLSEGWENALDELLVNAPTLVSIHQVYAVLREYGVPVDAKAFDALMAARKNNT